MVEKRGNELGVRATFDKRYITLAPVAGVVGLVGGPWLGVGVGVGVGEKCIAAMLRTWLGLGLGLGLGLPGVRPR